MESVKNREVKFNKEGVMIVKTTYQAFNRSFRRNINVVKWTASFEGEFATGYTMKDAVHRVMKEVNKKIN